MSHRWPLVLPRVSFSCMGSTKGPKRGVLKPRHAGPRSKAEFASGQPPAARRRIAAPLREPSREEVAVVCSILEQTYGSPRHGNPFDPLDDLVYIVLSNRTSAPVAARVYAELKGRSADWGELLRIPESELREMLAPAGLSAKRAASLRGILMRLLQDFGEARLDALAGWTVPDAERYLTSLPGVSDKVAKCVLMYGLGRPVLPVDVHLHRLATRLGWISHRRADQSHETLEALVPADLRYGLHVNAIAHGRAVCKSGLPRCGQCVISMWCDYFRAGLPAQEEPSAP